jgi:hypothetical protein
MTQSAISWMEEISTHVTSHILNGIDDGSENVDREGVENKQRNDAWMMGPTGYYPIFEESADK